MKSTHRQPRFLYEMYIISKQFKIVQNKFPFGNQEIYRLIFSFCSENVLLRDSSLTVRSGFGTDLQLMKSADFNLSHVFQNTHPKNLCWNTERLIFGIYS
jgi:hypothetical protein